MKTKTFTCNLKGAFHLINWCTPLFTTALLLSIWMSNGFAQCIECPPEAQLPQCGPGPDWMTSCPAGFDTICTAPQVGFSFEHLDNPNRCKANASATLNGLTIVQRSGAVGDVITTEIISLCATGVANDGNTYELIAGFNNDDLGHSYGQIVESSTDNTQALSSFDVFFKVVTPWGDEVYNHDALVLQQTIDQVPPLRNTSYDHIDLDSCINLYPCPPGIGCGPPVARLVEANHEVCKLTTHIHTPAVYVGGDLHFSVYIKHVLSRPATTPITFKIADMNGNIVYSRATGDYVFNQGDELSLNEVMDLPSNLSPGTYFLLFDIRGMSDPLAKGQLFTIKN